MSNPIVKPCSCTSSYQDKKYGVGMRLFTVGSKSCCTVCGKPAGSGAKK